MYIFAFACVCLIWNVSDSFQEIHGSPAEAYRGLITQLTSASRAATDSRAGPVPEPRPKPTQRRCHRASAERRRTSLNGTSPPRYLPTSARLDLHLETKSTPLQITTQYVARKSSSVPANRLRHSTEAERSFSSYLVCNVEYSHLPNSARTELLHEG